MGKAIRLMIRMNSPWPVTDILPWFSRQSGEPCILQCAIGYFEFPTFKQDSPLSVQKILAARTENTCFCLWSLDPEPGRIPCQAGRRASSLRSPPMESGISRGKEHESVRVIYRRAMGALRKRANFRNEEPYNRRSPGHLCRGGPHGCPESGRGRIQRPVEMAHLPCSQASGNSA